VDLPLLVVTVAGVVTIASGTTLSAGPGTVIEFVCGSRNPPSMVKVDGALRLEGTEAEPVVVRCANGTESELSFDPVMTTDDVDKWFYFSDVAKTQGSALSWVRLQGPPWGSNTCRYYNGLYAGYTDGDLLYVHAENNVPSSVVPFIRSLNAVDAE